MRYISFCRPDGQATFGRLEGDTVVDCDRDGLADLQAGIACGDLSALEAVGTYSRAEIKLLPIILNPGKLFCVDLTYADHVKETGPEQKDHPAIFHRWADTLVAHGDPLVRPRESTRFDYEGELAVIIGKRGRRIPRSRAFDYVAGYSIFQDASVRDWQRLNIQFTPGKNFPATGGFGPAMVTLDEIDNLGALRVVTRLNGEIIQNQSVLSNTHRISLDVHRTSARRRDLDRNPGRGRRQTQVPALQEERRCRRCGDRRHWNARELGCRRA